MRIALDADHLYRFPLRGIQKTTLSVYAHLLRERPGWKVTAYRQANGRCPELETLPGVEVRRIDYRGERFIGRFHPWNSFRLPVASIGSDLVHAPASHGPWWSTSPIALTIHDLTPIEFPAAGSDEWWHRVRRSARAARRIITCSRHVADRIRQELPATAGRIEVVYWGRNESYRPAAPAEIARVRTQHGIEARPYVLAFGTKHPRKNIGRLLAAWHGLPDSITAEFDLVIAGSTRADLEALGLAGPAAPSGIRTIAALQEEDIPAVISGASLLCYLSLSEGFGLPVLEAFACGAPVLASATSSVPEVAGDAAVLVDPESESAIRGALMKMLESASLRDELRAAGLVRATVFDWTTCAREYARIFEDCVR